VHPRGVEFLDRRTFPGLDTSSWNVGVPFRFQICCVTLFSFFPYFLVPSVHDFMPMKVDYLILIVCYMLPLFPRLFDFLLPRSIALDTLGSDGTQTDVLRYDTIVTAKYLDSWAPRIASASWWNLALPSGCCKPGGVGCRGRHPGIKLPRLELFQRESCVVRLVRVKKIWTSSKL
jgi:hypothetical protein